MSEPLEPLAARLTPGESELMAIHVAQLASARLPLGEGLRAAAREAGSRRLARALARLGDAVQRGSSLAEALEECGGSVPPHLSTALVAAERSGRLAPVLAEWTENQLAAAARRRHLTQALAYPVICLTLAIAVFSLIGALVTPPFEQMFREMELPLGMQTIVVLRIGRNALPALGITLSSAAGLLIAVRLAGGRAGWWWLKSQTPLLGRLWHWSGVAEVLRVLAVLVEHDTPLPDALRLAGQGTSDAHVGRIAAALAVRVEAGESLAASVEQDGRYPLSLAPLLRAGEKGQELASSARQGAAMLEERIVARCDLVAAIVPPLVFLLVAVSGLSIVTALTLPLLTMIRGLSW